MSELIDRRLAIKAIDDLPNCYNGFSDTYDKAYIIGVLEELPPAAPRWHRVEEEPKEDGKYVAINVKTKWWYEARYENGNWKAVDLFGQRWVVIHPTHWMPIDPPKEDNNG